MLEPFTAPTEFPHQGQRVVEGQRLTQSSSDIMLGWLSAVGPGREEARLLRAPALGPEGLGQVDTMTPGAMSDVRADLRRDPRARARPLGDRIAIGAYLASGDSFDQAMARFAVAYADQNERDYAALQDAVADGRLAVQRESE